MIKRIIPIIFLIFSMILMISCGQQEVKPKPSEEKIFGLWLAYNYAPNLESWNKRLKKFNENSITDIFLSATPDQTKDFIELASKQNIKTHAWIWTLNAPNDEEAMKHPEWYAVNRLGQNSLEYRAYVDYYQWLSPFSEGAREHIKSKVANYLSIDGLESIHLDYVRYVDVILGADLQPKYNLQQDHQMPEFDYDYHPNARAEFKELFGVDPMDLENPELDMEWLQFRLNAVTALVNDISYMVHLENKKLSAAVFPYPEMSRQMVRQDWSSWDLDIAVPMIYHNFYRQNMNWIQFATEQGVRESKGKFKLVTGLFLPSLNENSLNEAIKKAFDGGADGICLFGLNQRVDFPVKIIGRFSKK
ncbi:MAG: family 10 glycosylhydrolase [Melioribacteraceae bacterium]|nr:family 10 glycosylhydrolase [Melioribacteraceae bacterium]